jgi:serine phosphatase RsbU (regulator of sigma subunit)
MDQKSNGRAAFHPITLAFRDSEIERDFLREHSARSISIVRLSLLFAALLYILYSFLDYQVIPGRASLLLVIRALGAVALAVVAIFSVLRQARKYLQLTMSLVILVAGSGVVAMLLIAEQSGWHGYYGGLILTLIYAHALLRLRFIYATLTSWALVGLYALGSALLTSPPAGVTMNNLFYVVSGNLLGMFSSYGLEYYGRTVFLKTRMLDESQRELAEEFERTSSELGAVREIQLAMLPKELPGHPEIELAVMMDTAAEVGGDYYDFVSGQDGKLTFAIGDATGHGARAGALVTASKLLFSTYAERDTPDKFLERASHILRRMKFPKLYMTMAVGKICGLSLVIAGAGMPPALLLRAGTGKVEQIALKGIPLGSAYDGTYNPQEVSLSPGDTLLLMSDGFPELFNGKNSMLGYERIELALLASAGKSPADIVDQCRECVAEWKGEEPLRDDLTILVMKVKPG